MLHRVAKRHVNGECTELSLEFRKAVHHERRIERSGWSCADERGRGRTNAFDGARARWCFFNKNPGGQMLGHGGPSCGGDGGIPRRRVEAGGPPVHRVFA